MLNFEMLKDAKCGETLLIKEFGSERLFMGIVNNRILTCEENGTNACFWTESQIENWSIKKETKKLYQYAYKSGRNGRWYIPGGLYSDDNDFLDAITNYTEFKRLDNTMIEVDE